MSATPSASRLRVQLGAGAQAAYKGHPIICMTGDGRHRLHASWKSKRWPSTGCRWSSSSTTTTRGARGRRRRGSRWALPIHLFQENLRYDKIAEALGGHGEYVTRPAEFRPALERAYEVAVKERRPSVINCQGRKEFWDREKFPPGSLGKIEPGVMSYYH